MRRAQREEERQKKRWKRFSRSASERYTDIGSPMTNHELLYDVTQRLVEWYRPERIYLFGSQARGNVSENSDFDFLVVVADTSPRDRWYENGMFAALADIDVPIDVVVWTKSRFEERVHLKASLPATVEREGRLLYAA